MLALVFYIFASRYFVSISHLEERERERDKEIQEEEEDEKKTQPKPAAVCPCCRSQLPPAPLPPCLPASPLLRPVTLWHLVSHLVIGLAAVVAVAADEAAARRRRDVRLRLLLFYVLFFVFCTNFCKNLLKCARYTHATLVPGKREQQQQHTSHTHTHTHTPRIVLGCPCTEGDTKIQRYDAHTLQLYTVIPKDIPTYIL